MNLTITPLKKRKKSKKKSSKKPRKSPIKKVNKKPIRSPIKVIGNRKNHKKYCGNNALSPHLIENGGNKILGTNYECLKTGIGFGIHAPLDMDFINYQAIDPPDNIYCGDKTPLPDRYDAFGKRSSCLRKGVGQGKRIALQRAGHL
jgi:hypothetical protein